MRSDLLRDIDEHSVSTDASACDSFDSDALYDSDDVYASHSDGTDAENENDDAENTDT